MFKELTVNRERVASTEVPVLGIMGSEDRIFNGSPGSLRVEEFGKALPNFEMIIVEGATHFGESGLMHQVEFIEADHAFIAEN